MMKFLSLLFFGISFISCKTTTTPSTSNEVENINHYGVVRDKDNALTTKELGLNPNQVSLADYVRGYLTTILAEKKEYELKGNIEYTGDRGFHDGVNEGLDYSLGRFINGITGRGFNDPHDRYVAKFSYLKNGASSPFNDGRADVTVSNMRNHAAVGRDQTAVDPCKADELWVGLMINIGQPASLRFRGGDSKFDYSYSSVSICYRI